MSDMKVLPETGNRILSLGLLFPKTAMRDSVESVMEAGPEVTSELLYRNKVISISRGRLEQATEEAPPSARPVLKETVETLANRTARLAVRWQTSEEVFSKVTQFSREEGIPWRTMKGFSFRPLYLGWGQRDVRDLDVWVPTMDAAWRLARRLRGYGYIYSDELPWFKKDMSTGEIYGQIRVGTPGNDRLAVDIHAGPYSVRHCAVMPLRRTGDGESGTPISFDDDVCVAVANAAGDCFMTGKMVNDLVLAANTEIDIEYVQDSLDRAGLLPFLAACLHRVHELCHLTETQNERLGLLIPDVQPEPIPPVFGADQDERCEVTVAHARAIARRLFPTEDARVAAITGSAREAYEKEQSLHLVEDDVSVAVGLPTLNNWTCVRLVPEDLAVTLLEGLAEAVPSGGRGAKEALTEEMAVETSDRGTVIHAAGETFVPTVDYGLPKRLIASLSR